MIQYGRKVGNARSKECSITEYQVEFSPGVETSPQFHQCGVGEQPLQSALHWLELVKRELETPDLWDEVMQQRRVLSRSTSPDVENIPFSPEEVRLITARLERILEGVVATHDLPSDQVRLLTEQIDYIKKAASRFGRKDWIFVTIGAFSIISNYLLAPAASRDLFKALMNLIREIREIVNIRVLLP